MNKNNWIKNTAFFFTFLSLLTVKIPQALAENSTGNSTIYLAKTSAYDRYMARGYAATRSRNYRQALGYFQQALQVRPGDRYARAAINNVQGYINRISRRNIRIIAGKPGPTKGGASRGEACIQLDKTIIAVTPVPKDNKNSSEDSQNDTDKEEAPKTSSTHPTFFFYVPLKADSKPQLFEFSLRDNNANKNIFYGKYQPINESGIVGITIPSKSPALEVGKEYTWTFSAVCDRKDFSKSHFVEGKIQRTELDSELQTLLQDLQGLEKVNWYASSGYWEDAIRELAKLSPNNETRQAWRELLQSGNIRSEAIEAYPPLPVELQPLYSGSTR